MNGKTTDETEVILPFGNTTDETEVILPFGNTTDETEVILPFEGRSQSLVYQKQMKQKSFYRLREGVNRLFIKNR